MGKLYTVSFEGVAVTAAVDFFEIRPADDKPVAIHAIYLSQSTEIGDAQEEFLRVQIGRGHTTSGSGGGVPTPVAVNPAYDAAGFGADTNNTTIASLGTNVAIHSDTFNVRAGWIYLPTPEMRPITKEATGFLVVRLMAAPADSVTFNGTIYVEELT